MKRSILAGAAFGLISTFLLAGSSAQAAPYGKVTAGERHAIAHSKARVNALKWRIRADGRVTALERMRLNLAQARHNGLVARYRHN